MVIDNCEKKEIKEGERGAEKGNKGLRQALHPQNWEEMKGFSRVNYFMYHNVYKQQDKKFTSNLVESGDFNGDMAFSEKKKNVESA